MSPDIGPSPPWFVAGPDGRVSSILAIHDRLLHHPDLQRRGIVLREPMKPGCVYCTCKDTPPVYAVKILNPHTEEVAVQARVLRERGRPDNHTLPGEMTVEGHPLLIMPAIILVQDKPVLVLSLSDIMDVALQVIEGVEFLHSLHIAHMDICLGNLLLGSPFEPFTDPTLPHGIIANRIYIIDFGQSKQLALGPGVQRAITLPETQIPPPDGLRHFDPYAWDVHCVGRTMQELLEYRCAARAQPRPVPRLAQGCFGWLVGRERGCMGVCRCRPTAREALRMVIFMRWAAGAPEGYGWVVGALEGMWLTDGRG